MIKKIVNNIRNSSLFRLLFGVKKNDWLKKNKFNAREHKDWVDGEFMQYTIQDYLSRHDKEAFKNKKPPQKDGFLEFMSTYKGKKDEQRSS